MAISPITETYIISIPANKTMHKFLEIPLNARKMIPKLSCQETKDLLFKF